MESPTSFSEPDGGAAGGVGGMGGLVEAFTPEMREKMVKLEKQNQILQRRVDAAESASREAGEGRVWCGQEKSVHLLMYVC